MFSPKLSNYSSSKKNGNVIKTGYLEIVRSGTGFLITSEEEKDIKINRRKLLNALHNDLVKVRVINKNGKKSGEVIEIKKRDKSTYPVIIDEKNKIILKSGGRNVECILKNNKEIEKIKGKRLTINIDKWNPNESKPVVIINQILGDIGDINTEIRNIIIENKIKRGNKRRLYKTTYFHYRS
jgi:exoribonuclease R